MYSAFINKVSDINVQTDDNGKTGLGGFTKAAFSNLKSKVENAGSGDGDGVNNFKNADKIKEGYKQGVYFNAASNLDLGSSALFGISKMLGIQNEMLDIMGTTINEIMDNTDNKYLKSVLSTTFQGIIQGHEAQKIAKKKEILDTITSIFKPIGIAAVGAFTAFGDAAGFIKDEIVQLSSHFINNTDDFFSNLITGTGFLAPFVKILYPYLKAAVTTATKILWKSFKGITGMIFKPLKNMIVGKLFGRSENAKNAEKANDGITAAINGVTGAIEMYQQITGTNNEKLSELNNTLKGFSGENIKPTSEMLKGMQFSETPNKFTNAAVSGATIATGVVAGAEAFDEKNKKKSIFSKATNIYHNAMDASYNDIKDNKIVKKIFSKSNKQQDYSLINNTKVDKNTVKNMQFSETAPSKKSKHINKSDSTLNNQNENKSIFKTFTAAVNNLSTDIKKVVTNTEKDDKNPNIIKEKVLKKREEKKKEKRFLEAIKNINPTCEIKDKSKKDDEGGLLSTIVDAASTIISGIGSILGSGFSMLLGGLGIAGILGALGTLGGFIVDGLITGVKNIGEWILEGIKSIGSKIVSGIASIFGSAGDWISSLFSSGEEATKPVTQNGTKALKDTSKSAVKKVAESKTGKVATDITKTAATNAGKIAAKSSGFAGKVASKALTGLKSVPILGSVVSLGFAAHKLSRGDVTGALIDAVGMIPGLGLLSTGANMYRAVDNYKIESMIDDEIVDRNIFGNDEILNWEKVQNLDVDYLKDLNSMDLSDEDHKKVEEIIKSKESGNESPKSNDESEKSNANPKSDSDKLEKDLKYNGTKKRLDVLKNVIFANGYTKSSVSRFNEVIDHNIKMDKESTEKWLSENQDVVKNMKNINENKSLDVDSKDKITSNISNINTKDESKISDTAEISKNLSNSALSNNISGVIKQGSTIGNDIIGNKISDTAEISKNLSNSAGIISNDSVINAPKLTQSVSKIQNYDLKNENDEYDYTKVKAKLDEIIIKMKDDKSYESIFIAFVNKGNSEFKQHIDRYDKENDNIITNLMKSLSDEHEIIKSKLEESLSSIQQSIVNLSNSKDTIDVSDDEIENKLSELNIKKPEELSDEEISKLNTIENGMNLKEFSEKYEHLEKEIKESPVNKAENIREFNDLRSNQKLFDLYKDEMSKPIDDRVIVKQDKYEKDIKHYESAKSSITSKIKDEKFNEYKNSVEKSLVYKKEDIQNQINELENQQLNAEMQVDDMIPSLSKTLSSVNVNEKILSPDLNKQTSHINDIQGGDILIQPKLGTKVLDHTPDMVNQMNTELKHTETLGVQIASANLKENIASARTNDAFNKAQEIPDQLSDLNKNVSNISNSSEINHNKAAVVNVVNNTVINSNKVNHSSINNQSSNINARGVVPGSKFEH